MIFYDFSIKQNHLGITQAVFLWFIFGTTSPNLFFHRMCPPVFIPRPETEQLVSLVLQDKVFQSGAARLRVLEIGCGSGAVSLSLLSEAAGGPDGRRLRVTAVDQGGWPDFVKRSHLLGR